MSHAASRSTAEPLSLDDREQQLFGERLDGRWLEGAKKIRSAILEAGAEETGEALYGAALVALDLKIEQLQQRISIKCAPWFEVRT